MKIPTTVVTLMALAAGLLSAAPAATADPASEVTVVWPEVTRFNPTSISYDPVITNDGDGHLFYSWGDPEVPVSYVTPRELPESGHIDMAQVQSAVGVVRIWSCPAMQWSGGCTVVARSPRLEVYSRLAVGPRIWTGEPLGPGPVTVSLNYWPKPAATEVPRATWELVDTGGNPLNPAISGTISASTLAEAGPDTPGHFTIEVPETLPSATYYLDVQMSMDTADFGPLVGTSASSVWTEFDLDSTPPSLHVAKLPPVFYPVRDNYRDLLAVTPYTDGDSPATFEVVSKTGTVVYRRRADLDDTHTIYWNGRANRNGYGLVPAGRYGLALRIADRLGNTTVWTGTITVSRKRLLWKAFARNVTANASRIGKPFVGRCARLAAPASGGPRGSLGFYSESKCQGGAKAGTVFTNHGMYLPKAFEARYAWARVTLNGGPATTSSRNYIVMMYQTPPDSDHTYREEFRKGNGAHEGPVLWPDDIFDRKSEKPYIVWSNGLTNGSRYDVRSYTVKVRYRVLR